MRFGFLAAVGLTLLLLGWIGCSSSSSSSTTGTLFVATSGDSTLTPFSITLNNGTLTQASKTAATGASPVAAVLSNDGNSLFVLNQGDNTISAYTVNSDGTASAAGSPVPTNSAFALSSPCASVGDGTTSTPVSMTLDSAGHLFVVNLGVQGNLNDPTTHAGAVSVFSVSSGTSLAEISGSPFCTSSADQINGGQTTTGPAALAVTSDGKYLYVTNSLINTVTQYNIQAGPTDITLTLQNSYNTGTTPSGALIVPNGGFLYVSNSGTNNVSAFAICNTVLTSCSNPNQPDGTLTEVTDSPFSAGLGPLSMVASLDSKFLYVVNAQGNQISEFKVSTGTGALSANTQPTISTGANPVSIALRQGTTTIKASGGTENFVFVTNRGAATLSIYAFDSTTGILSVVGPVVDTGGQPSAVVAK